MKLKCTYVTSHPRGATKVVAVDETLTLVDDECGDKDDAEDAAGWSAVS